MPLVIDFFTIQKYNNLKEFTRKDNSIMKAKYLALAAMMAVAVSVTGCAGKASLKGMTEGSESTSLKDQFKNGSDDRENKQDEDQKLTFEEIEELAKNNVFCVTWYAENDSFSSGTAFLLDSEKHNEKLLVTAFHFLVPEDASSYTGKDLPEYLQGGQIFYDHSFEATGASIKNCVVIEDAASFPEVEKDVAAFTIQSGDELKTLPLSTHEPKKGDKIYLLANLWDTDDVHENCVYECKVKSADEDCVYYELDSRYGTTGASGAPIVNEYGEVIGIHMGTMGGSKVAHSAESFLKQIDNGTISDITYPEKSETEDTSSSEEGDFLEFTREDKVNTMFYDIQIDQVEISDTIGDTKAEDGYEFISLEVRMRANKLYDEPVSMYYDDFIVVVTGGDYGYPLETGIDEAQLQDEYTINSGDDTIGKLIFSIPKGEEQVGFYFEDYYTEGDSDELQYGDMYLIEIPVENWSR